MAISTAQQIIALKSPDHASDPRLDDFVKLSKFHISQTVFGTKYQYALALMVLHWITLDAQGGGSSSSSGSGVVGGIKSEKEGDLQRTYNLPSGKDERDSYLRGTVFGSELLQLWKTIILIPRTKMV